MKKQQLKGPAKQAAKTDGTWKTTMYPQRTSLTESGKLHSRESFEHLAITSS